MKTHYQQMTQVQRYQIEAGLACGKSQASIAKQVGVHPSTVSRELRRNRSRGLYQATHAQYKNVTCTLQSLIRHGSAVQMKIRMVCCVGFFLKAETLGS